MYPSADEGWPADYFQHFLVCFTLTSFKKSLTLVSPEDFVLKSQQKYKHLGTNDSGRHVFFKRKKTDSKKAAIKKT